MIEKLAFSFKEALISNDRVTAENIFNQAKLHVERDQLIEKLIVGSLKDIGELWDTGEVSLAEVYLSSKICESLALNLAGATSKSINQQLKVGLVNLIDQHSLGRQIVYSSLIAAGIVLTDYGSGVTPEEIVEYVLRDQIDVLLVSVLMYPTALELKEVKRLLDEQGIIIKILVGGAPFNMDPELWKRVGADAMGKTPSDDIAMIEIWNQEAAL